MKKLFVVTLVAAIIFGILALPALAETKKVDQVRLERGVKNVALGLTEIPNAIVKVTKETNNPILGITAGLVKGILNTFARTASGAIDVVAAPINPKDKEALMKPTMVSVESTK